MWTHTHTHTQTRMHMVASAWTNLVDVAPGVVHHTASAHQHKHVEVPWNPNHNMRNVVVKPCNSGFETCFAPSTYCNCWMKKHISKKLRGKC